jgi:hypothetical protein
MGVEVTAYLGPYVEYTVRVLPRTVSRCPEPAACPKPTENFCQRCGKRASDILVLTNYEEPKVDFTEDYDEAFYTTNFYSQPMIFEGRCSYRALPNQSRPGRPEREDRWDAKRGEETATNVAPEQIGVETAWFETAFAPELKKLRDQCGHDNVRVLWGLIIYCS